MRERFERFDKYMLFKGLNDNQVTVQCGLSQGLIGQARSGKSDLGPKTIDKILNVYQDLSRVWLLTGEGEMIKEPLETGRKYLIDEIEMPSQEEVERVLKHGHWVPLINIDSVGGVWSQNALTSSEQYVERMIPFESAQPDDVAIYQSGDSMSPTIPPGAILQLRKVEGWQEYFGYGDVYVLWLKDNRRITKLVKCYQQDPDNYVLCCSYNPEAADEKLPLKFIREVWKVINILIPKGW